MAQLIGGDTSIGPTATINAGNDIDDAADILTASTSDYWQPRASNPPKPPIQPRPSHPESPTGPAIEGSKNYLQDFGRVKESTISDQDL